MKKAIISLIALTLCVLLMTFCLSACGEKDADKAKETTAATTAPTEAATEVATEAATAAAGTEADNGQEATAADEQQEAFDQNTAVQNAIDRAAELHGAGDWICVSVEEATAPDGAQGYKVGVTNDADPSSPTYYFYSGYLFCYEA